MNAVLKSKTLSKSDRESASVFSRSPAAIRLKTMSPMSDVERTCQCASTVPASRPYSLSASFLTASQSSPALTWPAIRGFPRCFWRRWALAGCFRGISRGLFSTDALELQLPCLVERLENEGVGFDRISGIIGDDPGQFVAEAQFCSPAG